MARVNVEDSIYRDPRFIDLAIELGMDAALGCLVRAWDLAQRHFLSPSHLIPEAAWKAARMNEALIRSGLARREDGGIYVCGTREACSFIITRRENGKKGGLKTQENAVKHPEHSQALQASPSPSPSGEEKTCTQHGESEGISGEGEELRAGTPLRVRYRPSDESLEAAYKLYPKRDGAQKKAAAFARLRKSLSSPEDLERFTLACRRYAAHIRKTDKWGTEFVAMFSTFVGDWQEWAEGLATVAPVVKSFDDLMAEKAAEEARLEARRGVS